MTCGAAVTNRRRSLLVVIVIEPGPCSSSLYLFMLSDFTTYDLREKPLNTEIDYSNHLASSTIVNIES